MSMVARTAGRAAAKLYFAVNPGADVDAVQIVGQLLENEMRRRSVGGADANGVCAGVGDGVIDFGCRARVGCAAKVNQPVPENGSPARWYFARSSALEIVIDDQCAGVAG